MSDFPTNFSVEHPTGASFETANVSVERLMGASFETEAGR
jgi:hypothetical protein